MIFASGTDRYFESPPALQFLHCLEASVDGGESIFLDSFKAVERLRAEDPAALAVLKRVPVTFHYMNNGHRMRYRRPTIIEGGMNEPLQVYYAPPFQGPLDGRPEDMAEFYAAFKKFSALVSDERMMVEHRLRPGECVIFANRRVLHGRRSFDSTSGKRWLKGTYVDQDVFHDRVEFAEHDRKKG